MKKLVTILLVLTMSVTACAWLVDWGDAGSRQELECRLEVIDRLFVREKNLQTFIEALNEDRGFGIGILTFDTFAYRRFLVSETCGKGQEEVIARHFLNELLNITQSKLDSLMELK